MPVDKLYLPESKHWSSNRRATHGPKRICTFCLLGILLPVTVLMVPLYMRYQALRPHVFTLSPSDMKLLNQESRVSTVWCQAQELRMRNASFNAYLMEDRPKLHRHRNHVTMHRKMVLEDDIKEYWGFYLIRGSIVGLSVCARHEGASFIVVKGMKDARRCSFLGELDSDEEDESDESREAVQYSVEDDNSSSTSSGHNPLLELQTLTKEELLQRYLNLHNERIKSDERIPLYGYKMPAVKSNKEAKSKAYMDLTDDEVENAASEVFDDDDGIAEDPVYDLVDQGKFNQKNKKGGKEDRSREEVRSSWSSSEEALMRCEGLIFNVPLGGAVRCDQNATRDELRNISTEVTLDVADTGFYYFIFANENEIVDNFLSASFDLHKTAFDVSNHQSNCTNATVCSFPLNFWSQDNVVLELPDDKREDGEEDPCDAILGFSSLEECHRVMLVESVCQPRRSVYMVCLLLVPVLVLVFAHI